MSRALALGASLSRILNEAEDIGRRLRVQPHSGHVLLAFFVVGGRGAKVLKDLAIDEDRLLETGLGKSTEARSEVRALLERAALIAGSCGDEHVEALHVLVAMTRQRDSVAHGMLSAAGKSAATIRARALSVLTDESPRWVTVRPTRRPHQATARSRVPALSGPPTPAGAPSSFLPSAPPDGLASVSTALAREPQDTPWSLDPDRFPWLSRLGRNLSEEAARGELDELVGREDIVERLIDVLGKRRANNPCLVGEPGVGKTAVVEGLARRSIEAPEGSRARSWVFVALDVGTLLVGTHLRGSFSEKLQGLKEEVEASQGRVIVFLDELHTLIGAGSSGDGPLDAANELKAALARGRFPCIGATTPSEHRRWIEGDPALSRRFVRIEVPEPSREEATQLLFHLAPVYAEHHGVGYRPEALKAAVTLSTRYVPHRRLPDKALSLVDLAGSRAARQQREVDEELMAELVAEQTGLPKHQLVVDDSSRLLALEAELEKRIVGQTSAIRALAESVRRGAAGFGGARPRGVFLFLGPTGVGKTETAKALARALQGPTEPLIRFDMNEFTEAHTVARLVGAPPGYVGHERGGELTEAVRRHPGRVILFDEIEKAHPDVQTLLLGLLDEGALRDARGQRQVFTESVIIMTSNAGCTDTRPVIGFDSREDEPDTLLERARHAFPPELWGRISDRLVFRSLGREELLSILARIAAGSNARLASERGIRFSLDQAASRFVVDQCGEDGARALRAAFERLVEGPIARKIMEARIHAGDHVEVRGTRGRLRFFVEDESLSGRPG
ncbi:MAG: ATP-dependent Clp protease ATP-binding subunit [Myxococcota bacterium]